MRTTKIKLGGQEVELRLSFAVLERITDTVIDPLRLADESMREADAAQEGKTYATSLAFTFDTACRIFHVAQTSNMSLDEIKELAFSEGAIVAREVSLRYLSALITPQNSDKLKGRGGKNEGE